MNLSLSRELGRLFLEANPSPEERQVIVEAINSPQAERVVSGEELPGRAGALVVALRRRAAARRAGNAAG